MARRPYRSPHNDYYRHLRCGAGWTLSRAFANLCYADCLTGTNGRGWRRLPPVGSTHDFGISRAEESGPGTGFPLIGGSGSHFLAPLIAAAIAAIWGWRGSFIGLAVPTMIFGIIFYVLLGRRAKMSKTQQTITSHHDETPSPPGYLRRLVPFLILTTFTEAVTFSTIAFIPLFMVDHFGVGEGTAAAFLSIIYFAGLWASPLGGYLSDRLGRVPVTLVTGLITGPLIYLLNLVSYSLGISALLLIIGIAMYIRKPASESYILGQTPERHRSTVYGIYYFAGMEAGGILTPVMGLSK